MRASKNKSSKPRVSILCLTFNHKKYIRKALDSFLMQKTDFDYEILVNDDASNDGTTEILREYKKNYPDKIILNIQKENQYSLGKRNMIARYLLPKAKGEYIALCEGDDYWTDEKKLQKQVDFLDKNRDYSVCFHPVRVFFEDGGQEDYTFPGSRVLGGCDVETLLHNNFIQTNSVMYRAQKYDFKKMARDITPVDWYLHLYHAQFGNIGMIDEVMSDYRRHSAGIWWSGDDKNNFWRKHGIFHLNLYVKLLEIYGDNDKYREIIMNNVARDTANTVKGDNSKDGSLTSKVFELYPDFVRFSIVKNYDLANESNDVINEMNRTKQDLERKVSRLRNENDSIKKSWSYRISKAILCIPRKITKITKGE